MKPFFRQFLWRWRWFTMLSSLLALMLGCANNKLRVREWTELPPARYTIPPFAKHLAQYKIALDPGHGGLSHLPDYKRGPTGKEEAVMNLNVALHLKEFLRLAGAQVVMTREEDRFVSLNERAAIAARERCDFLISLHHNAGSRSTANYTTVFYHLHPDYSAMSMDLARATYFGLVEALRLPEISPEGLLADKLIYPAGFGLLRAAKLPAILLESSFFSNPQEERRLMQTEYNRREAYGIFLGLARWAASGVPSAKLIAPEKISRSKTPEIVYTLADGVSERTNRPNSTLAIFSESVMLKLNGAAIPAQLDLAKKRVRFQPNTPLRNGEHTVRLDLQNLFKQHNLPRLDTLIIAAPPDSISFHAPIARVPADSFATVPIEISVWDKDGEPVWDGTHVQVSAVTGQIENSTLRLQNGRAKVYYRSAKDIGTDHIFVAAETQRDTFAVELVQAGESRILSGRVWNDSTNTALVSAKVFLNEALQTQTDSNGFFFLPTLAPGEYRIVFQARGFHQIIHPLLLAAHRSERIEVRMRPILGALLQQQGFILDAAFGGSEPGEPFNGGMTAAQENLRLAQMLQDTLQWAGAEVEMIRSTDTTLATSARVAAVNKIARGWYLKLDYRKWEKDSIAAQCTIYPGNQAGERLALALNAALAEHLRAGTALLRNTNVPEVTLTNKTAIAVSIYCKQPENARTRHALFAGLVRFLQEEKNRVGLEEAAQ